MKTEFEIEILLRLDMKRIIYLFKLNLNDFYFKMETKIYRAPYECQTQSFRVSDGAFNILRNRFLSLLNKIKLKLNFRLTCLFLISK